MPLLYNYTEEFWRIYMMDKNDLINDTKCLLPCNYMEYKVRNIMPPSRQSKFYS